jgi:uncharacterized membrane protein
MLDYIYKSNSKLLLINGFKLLVVTLTPFSTSVLSTYINTPQQQTAVSIYAFNFALMGLSMFTIWAYAAKNQLMKEVTSGVLKTISHYYFSGGHVVHHISFVVCSYRVLPWLVRNYVYHLSFSGANHELCDQGLDEA